MNEAGGASHAGSLLPRIAAPPRGPIRPAWQPSKRRLSTRESVRACAFLMFYTAAYLAAGYAGVTFIEWVWMSVFR